LVHDEGVTFRVWAPKHREVRVVTGDGTTTRYVSLEPDGAGFFCGRDDHGRPGDTYWFQVDHRLVPDPASRFQPRGVDGPSQVVDAQAFRWQASAWQRPPLRGRVIYELHVGTFTREGTWRAATHKLDALADLGVNAIEVMPVAECAGRRNWGYDGVMLFAPTRSYGIPEEFRAFVDAAHARGLAVILDVVYNHLGPCGNVLPTFSDDYFRREGASIWGAGLNFSGSNSTPVREFFLQNVCQWFDEYRIDGLRLDAVHAIHDETEPHFIAEVAAAAHARGGFVIAEDDRNDARIITPRGEGGWGVDGMWSDDFHHVMRVALTGQREAHFANYTGAIDEWTAALREGWFYRGQHFASWKKNRGTPGAHLPPHAFVFCISNHDQVGNRPLGDRLSDVVSPEHYRAMSMLLCLSPYTPMLFQGQEWATRTPFPFFTDHPGEVGANMAQNRIREFKHYGAMYSDEMLARMPDPQAESTFAAAKLNWLERDRTPHAQVLALYRECLRLRREHAIFQSPDRRAWSVEPLGSAGLVLRWRDEPRAWALVASWQNDSEFVPPDDGPEWVRVLSSNEARFGGAAGTEFRGPAAVLWRRGAE
jgi:maltooligosyltrehalose trehalohydrolase